MYCTDRLGREAVSRSFPPKVLEMTMSRSVDRSRALSIFLPLIAPLLTPGAVVRGDSPCVNWSKSPLLVSRYFHAMAYDSARGVTVLFGGRDENFLRLGDTWESDGTTWTHRSPSHSPSARYGHAMVYDSSRGVTVLFGGINDNYLRNNYLDDTWEWDGAKWAQPSSATSPSARAYQAMAYDAGKSVTMLFGGQAANNGNYASMGDTWDWNSTNWTKHIPATSPSARAYHAMACDNIRGVTVMFGGAEFIEELFDYIFLNETWDWDGTNWTQRRPATSPSKRAAHAMAYDSARGVTALFGGYYYDANSDQYFGDTWEWDGTNWTQRSPATNPPARGFHAMAYDSARAVTVLFGGLYDDGNSHFLADTWEWNGTNWTQRTPTTSPSARDYHAMAYDSARGVTVLFGGHNGVIEPVSYLGDTWEWNGTTWNQISPTSGPAPRGGSAMAYDSAHGVTALYGGSNSSEDYFGDSWEFGEAAPDADVNLSGRGNGQDISAFTAALLNASTYSSDLCHGDFNGNKIIDAGDMPGFTDRLLSQ